jgi:hypothetical protein
MDGENIIYTKSIDRIIKRFSGNNVSENSQLNPQLLELAKNFINDCEDFNYIHRLLTDVTAKSVSIAWLSIGVIAGAFFILPMFGYCRVENGKNALECIGVPDSVLHPCLWTFVVLQAVASLSTIIAESYLTCGRRRIALKAEANLKKITDNDGRLLPAVQPTDDSDKGAAKPSLDSDPASEAKTSFFNSADGSDTGAAKPLLDPASTNDLAAGENILFFNAADADDADDADDAGVAKPLLDPASAADPGTRAAKPFSPLFYSRC